MRGAVALWLSAFLLVFALEWWNENELRKLKQDSAMTTGSVIASMPESHQTVRYRYEVNGESYTNLDGVWAIGKKAEDMRVGDSLPIYIRQRTPVLRASAIQDK